MNEWEKKDITAFRFWDGLISHKIEMCIRDRIQGLEESKMTVSVCIIAYNEEKTLTSLFSDIKNQDYPHNPEDSGKGDVSCPM